jgi:hypothetical protein
MALDKETQETIAELVTPIITSALTAALVAGAMAIISKLVVTNFKESGLTGDKELKPTDSETTISKAELASAEGEGKLTQNRVAGDESELEANVTKGQAFTGSMTAADTDAFGLTASTASSDVEIASMKMT